MDDAAVEARIRLMTQAAEDPKLTDSEVSDLVELARVPDLLRRRPGETGYEPTWEIYSVVAMGWMIKAAKVAGLNDVSGEGGSGLKLSQQHAQCLKMADLYNNMAANVTPVRDTAIWPTWVGNLNG